MAFAERRGQRLYRGHERPPYQVYFGRHHLDHHPRYSHLYQEYQGLRCFHRLEEEARSLEYHHRRQMVCFNDKMGKTYNVPDGCTKGTIDRCTTSMLDQKSRKSPIREISEGQKRSGVICSLSICSS